MKMETSSFTIDSSAISQYRVADLALYPMDNHLFLVFSHNNQATRLLQSSTVDVLLQCTEFKTLEEHIQIYCDKQQINPAARRFLRRELQHLAQSGYLVSKDSIQSLFHASDKSIPATRISAIGFPTCDRIEVLQRAMISYIEHCEQFGRNNEFVVMDDSASSETREAYQYMLRELKVRYKVNITYAGFEEKKIFIEKLMGAGNIPGDVASFACMGDKKQGITTVGANRNALLLHTVGDIFFSSDDDIICQIAASPEAREGLVLDSRGNPLDVWFYQNRENALQSVNFVAYDFLLQHEQWLGEDPKVCGITAAQDISISYNRADPHLLNRLATQSGKVALTLNGTIGDCSWDNPNHYLFQDGETFKRLTKSARTYEFAKASREMIQAVNQTTITDKSAPLFSMCMGLDNRDLLPPFTPIGRAEDVAFGTILAKCFNDIYTVHLPWVLLHAPSEGRTFSSQRMFSIGFNSWIPSCISLFDSGFAKTPAERLYKLGQHLEDIGHLPEASFREFARQHMWRNMSTLITKLEERMRSYEESVPDFWIQDAKAFIAQVHQIALLPVEQAYVFSGGQDVMQHLLIQFGEVLKWWPTMMETARILRTQGYRLAQPV